MFSKPLIVLLIIGTSTCLFAQDPVALPKDVAVVAGEELESIINEGEAVNNKNASVHIRSKAAMLLSFSDPARADKMLLALWKFTQDQTDEDFNKSQAKLLILKYLSARNPKLARQLLAEQGKSNDSSSGPIGRDDGLSGKLAWELAETDPATAAGLLERALSVSINPTALAALSRIRETSPILSDYVAGRALDALPAQPSISSLSGLFFMTAYVFPGGDAPIYSAGAENSLQILQYRYFITGLEVLRASLTETNEALARDQHYREADLQYRAVNQAQVAAILAALAPRFQPLLAPELNALMARLSPQVPASIAQMTRIALARLSGNGLNSNNPEENFAFSLSNGDFDDARKQLDRIDDEKKRELYDQLVIKSEARTLLAKSDLMGALTLIRKLQDQTTRLVIYLDALKAARKKQDTSLTSIVINEARLLIPQTDRNGIHLRMLLSFAAQLAQPDTKDDALEFLNSAIVTINALGRKSKDQGEAKTMAAAAMAELNDPKSLLDAAEMEQAFSAIGLLDLETGLTMARKIDVKPVQLMARLETVQGILKRRSLSPKAPQKSPKVTPKSNK
jgi:hypothetical protein